MSNANDGYNWLSSCPQSGYRLYKQEYGVALQSEVPAAYFTAQSTTQDPMSIAPTHHSSPYPPNQGYVRPATLHTNPAVQYQTTAPVSGYYQGPPQHSTPYSPMPSSTSVTAQGHRPHLPVTQQSTSIHSRASVTSHTPQGLDHGHDIKRRLIEASTTPSKYSIQSTITNAMPKPVSQGNLSSYSFSPQDTRDKTFLKNRVDIVKPLNKSEAALKPSYDPGTIARDVLIAAGRHPTEPALNHHLTRLRDVFHNVDNSSDLETFRWDLVDAEREEKPRDPPQAPMQVSTPPKEPSLLGAPPTIQTQRQAPNQEQHPTPAQPLEQSKLQQTQSPSIIQVQLPAATKPQPLNTLVQVTVRSPSVSSDKMVEKRPPGRPPGRTPGRPPGRPPGSSKIQAAPPPMPQVPYQVYSCEWDQCRAELHNLEMLAKHIYKVHVPYTLTCEWKGCTCSDNFPAAALVKHIRGAHLEPIAWKLGDGPSVPGTVGSTASKSHVPSTIPESPLAGGEDSLIFPANYSSIRAFNRVHGNNTQRDKAQGIFKAVQRLKEQIGVGLDPGGCQLATPARNERVSNEEDVYEVKLEG
ncbi:putative C2H2 finger domain protein [Aspergillus alliaceus]|uniref:putative C2H2 finger domain protein n=1 Tax=Petromyces alliaceus TaxID=209559 RepID=UPI0012A4B1FA|nr:uncharacterized protein BDW43DRAFT_108888 [Aspergillus alliaceus]KAB8232417.1 hypothetical protein BDW43DRAFT_108888 [Aspergillus alliaceus]